MLKGVIALAEVIIAVGGEFSSEWPDTCAGSHLPELLELITRYNMYAVVAHGCPLGLKNQGGEPLLKKWRFITTSARMASALETDYIFVWLYGADTSDAGHCTGSVYRACA